MEKINFLNYKSERLIFKTQKFHFTFKIKNHVLETKIFKNPYFFGNKKNEILVF